MPFRHRLERIAGVTGYDSLDVEARAPGVVYLASVECMTAVPDRTYDTILCSEVLEHVADPSSGLREMHRVLRPGGVLVLTVPFLARLHEEPNDYFRYTEHALRAMLTDAAFELEEIGVIGSVFSFLGHQLSTLLVTATIGLPVVEQVAFGLNAVGIVFPCRVLDRIFTARRKFPLGYALVARRR